MTDWRPMASAPRDNTPILLYLAVPSAQAVGTGGAPVVQIVIGDLYGPSNYLTGITGETVLVTHWMPLPEPPKGEK